MNPFYFLAVGMTAAQYLLVFVPLLAGLALCVFSLSRRIYPALALGFILMCSPFVAYQIRVAIAESALEERQSKVAALDRQRLPFDYPRNLLVEGQIDYGDAETLMVLGYFDMIAVTEDGHAHLYYFAHKTPECVESARKSLAGRRPTHAPAGCIVKTPGLFALDQDLIVLRTDHNARFAPSTVKPGGVAEVWLKQGDRKTLIDYRESAVMKRPDGMLNPFPESIDTGEGPHVAKMLAQLIDARTPAGIR